MINHEQALDSLPAYALEALNPAETHQMEEHLETCAACQLELSAYQQIVAALPLAVRQRTPPASIKQRLMAQIKPQAPAKTKTSSRAGISGWLRGLTPALGIASLVLILALGVSNIILWQRLNGLQAERRFHVVALAGTENSPDASGVLVISSIGDEGTLVVENLPKLDANHQYQLWLIRAGKRSNGGVFSVSESGYGYLSVTSPGSLLEFESFGITVEPAGGSPGPTGKKVLGGDL